MFTKFGRFLRCRVVDPETVVGAGGAGGGAATPKDEIDTAEKAVKQLHDLTEAVREDKITKEKFVEVMGELQDAIKDLRLRSESKMRFDAGVTKEIVKGGMGKAMLTPTKDERLKALQELSDDVHIVDGILGHTKRVEGYGGMKSLQIFQQFDGAYSDFVKAMDTAEAGGGAEWTPDASLSAEMQYAVELEARVTPLFPPFEMPQTPFKWPIRTSVGEVYRATENTDIDNPVKATKTSVGTAAPQFDAEKIMGRIGWSGELNERAIVPMLPELKGALVVAHANAKDKAVIDGQITAVIDTGDDPSGTASDVRNLWDGIRYYCSAGVNNKMVDLGSAWNVEGLNSIRKLLGKSGMKPGECAWIPSITNYYSLLTIKDDQNNNVVLTLEHYGGAATILTGELGKMFGIPMIPSDYIREDLNAAGIYDGVTETKTVLPIVHKKSWKFGTFGPFTVRSSDLLYLESDMLVVVTREQADFQCMFAAATQVAAALGYNIAP